MREDEFITQHIAEKKQKKKYLMGLAGKAALAGAGFALGAAVVACAAHDCEALEGCIGKRERAHRAG